MSRSASAPRIETWALTTDAERAHWDRWSVLLKSARHPTLARVTEVTRDNQRGSLTVIDTDSEDVQTWIARTGASLPERLAVLRAAAAALDALHAGTTAEGGVPHGGIGTATIRVDSNGATRIVGFSPWVGTVEAANRFVAPEFRPRDPATKAGDVWAFARTVAEVLGGPVVASAPDLKAVLQALRASPNTRRRPRLVRALHGALASPAEARPQPLAAWLASAVEGTAATEVTNAGSPNVASTSNASPQSSSRSFNMGSAAIFAIVLAFAVSGWLLRDHGGGPVARAIAPGSLSDGPIRYTPDAWSPTCGAGTGIAAEYHTETLDQPTDVQHLDRAAIDVVGGRWHQGRLFVTLSATSDAEPVIIEDVRVVRVGPLDPPNWLLRSSAPCPSPATTPDVRYVANLDHLAQGGRLTRPVAVGGSALATNGSFTLRTTPTVIAIDVSACAGNYAWRPVIDYESNSRSMSLQLLGVVRTFGLGMTTRQYALGAGKTAPRELLKELSGPDPACVGQD